MQPRVQVEETVRDRRRGVVKLSEAKAAMDAKRRADCRLADFHGRTPLSVASSHTALRSARIFR